MKSILTAIFLALTSGPAVCQTAQCSAVVPLVVLDEHTKVPSQRTDVKVTARIGGIPAQAKRLPQFDTTAKRVAILLDTSGSMRGQPELARAIAGQLARLLDASDEIAFVAFADQALQVTPAVKDRGAVLRAIAAAPAPSGRTAIRDTIAASLIQVPLREGDSVLLVSDGIDNRSKVSEQSLLDILATRRVRVFTAAIRNPSVPLPFLTMEEADAKTLLQDLEDRVGGFTSEVDLTEISFSGHPPRLTEASETKLMAMLRSLADAADHPMQIRVDWLAAPQGRNSLQPIRLEVTDALGHRLRGVKLVYPPKVACDEPAHADSAAPAKPN